LTEYSLIFLDADETLFDFKKAEEYALDQAFVQRALELNDETRLAYAEINAELWRRLEKGKIDQKSLRVERFRLLFERLGIDHDAASFSDAYVSWLSKASFLLDGAEDLCAYLSEKYELVILSNGIAEVQRGRFALSPIRDLVSDIVISEEEGCAKPDPAIFERALSRAGLFDKAQTLMIGDSLSSDIQGGANFGIDTCWINWSGAPNDTELRPTYEVRSLGEIKNIL
jgi:2-haloacid dehalogenase